MVQRFLGGRCTQLTVAFLVASYGCSSSESEQARERAVSQVEDLQAQVDLQKKAIADLQEKVATATLALESRQPVERLEEPKREQRMAPLPVGTDLKRERDLARIAQLPFDDRKISASLYEKIVADVLRLDHKDALYAVTGNGSSALAMPFAEAILAIIKNGIPDGYLVTGFWVSHLDETKGFVPVILTVAAGLKLKDEYDVLSLCKFIYNSNGRDLDELQESFNILNRRDRSEISWVKSNWLDDMKRESLLTHVLEEYLAWADSQ